MDYNHIFPCIYILRPALLHKNVTKMELSPRLCLKWDYYSSFIFIEMDDYLIVSPYNENSSLHYRMIVAVHIFLLGRTLFSLNINIDRVISKVFRWKFLLLVALLNLNRKVRVDIIKAILLYKVKKF